MSEASINERRPFRRVARAGSLFAMGAVALAFSLAGVAVPAAAHDAGVGQQETPMRRPCGMRIELSDAGELPMLHASCGGTGYVLGAADDFRLFDSLALGVMLVEASWQAQVRLFLVYRNEQGEATLEDATSIVAVAAGRTPTSGIEGLSLDYANFSARGIVGISAVGPLEPAGPKIEVAFGDYIELERQRAGSAPIQD